MGRHRTTDVESVRKRRRIRAIEKVEAEPRLPWWKRWFKGDWWWLVGFLLGLFTGCLAAYATLLWWLTGDMGRFFSGLF